MNDLLQPGHHPDADHLSAFAEHALPAHEKQQMLAHLATCPDCRALVYLTQQADLVPQTSSVETPQRHPASPRSPWFATWFSGWNLALPAAALAGLIFLTVHLSNRHTLNGRLATTTTASIEQTAPPMPASPTPIAAVSSEIAAPKPAHSLALKKTQPVATPQMAEDAGAVAAAPPPPPPIAAAQPAIPRALSLHGQVSGSAMAGLGGGAGGARASLVTGTGGAISGQVTDNAGAVIPHATITATNTLTGVQIARESTGSGDFSLAPLPPGTYNVEVSAKGFRRLLQENVQIAPFQLAGLNLKLSVGGSDTTVTITDAPPLLETANATLGGTIENEFYTNLPLSMGGAPRDPAAFQQLMPGVQQSPQQQASAGGASQGVYGGTGQTNLNANYIEGIPASNLSAQAANSPAAPPVSTGATAVAVDALSAGAGTGVVARAKALPTLPSRLPTLSVVANTRQTLAIDTAGSLFRSDDAGVTWHPVPAQWQGRAIAIRLAQPRSAVQQAAAKNTASAAEARQQTQTLAPPAPAFELTTASGAIWTSPNGQTWQRK